MDSELDKLGIISSYSALSMDLNCVRLITCYVGAVNIKWDNQYVNSGREWLWISSCWPSLSTLVLTIRWWLCAQKA